MVSSLQLSRMARLAMMAKAAEDEMLLVGIFAPNYGLREDIPKISLSDAFTADNRNVLMQKGRIERAKMRLPEFLERAFSTGTITATNGSKVITSSEGPGTWSSSATHKPNWTGRKIKITNNGEEVEYEIESINDAGDEITLTENYVGTGEGLVYSIGTPGLPVKAPDDNPIIRYHKLIKMMGPGEIEYILSFTKAHAYLWNQSWSAWLTKFTCASPCLQWDTVIFNQQVIATNGVDKIQVWGTTIGNWFANLTGDPGGIDIGGGTYLIAAKYIEVFENYVIAAYVTIGNDVYPKSRYWCRKDDETDWDQTGEGDAGDALSEEGGAIRGLKSWGHYLIIAKETQLRYCWLVTGPEVFNEDKLAEQGCRAAHSMVIDGEGRFYWLAEDYTIRYLPGGESISEKVDETMKNINPALEKYSEAFYLGEYGLVAFSIPVGSKATGNNTVLWYEPKESKWGKWDLEIAAFGRYTRQEVYSWKSLPFGRWSEWGWDSWTGPENIVGFGLNLCSDYNGYSFDLHAAEKDNGQNYTGSFVLSTDLLERILFKRMGTTLRQFKRLQYIQLYFERESSGTAKIEIKRDGEKTWQDCGSISLEDKIEEKETIIKEIRPDLRARYFLIRTSAQNKFEFIGMILGFLPAGTR